MVVPAMTTTQDTHRAERHNLIRHYLEMVAAMIVGMAVLGAAAQMVCVAVGHPGSSHDPRGPAPR